MDESLAEFLRYLALEKNASPLTVKSYREDLTQAVGFFRSQGLVSPAHPRQLTVRHLRAYTGWLHDQGYAKATIARRLAAVRSWLRFLRRQGSIDANPADGLRTPRQDKKLPHFLPERSMSQLLDIPPTDSWQGLRDRAILEALYSAGLRVSELVGLDLNDLDLDAALAKVRGKGKRERLAMFGSESMEALRRWLEARSRLLAGLGSQRALKPSSSTRAAPGYRPQCGPIAGKVPRPGRAGSEDQPAQFASQLCHAPAGPRSRHPQRAGTFGPSEFGNHPDLHPCVDAAFAR